MAVNITTNNNTVKVVTTPANKVKVVNNITNTSVTVSQPTPTQVVRVVTAGPQGPQGPQGEGANINTGSFATTGSNTFIGDQTITGSLTVSGSNTFTNIGPAVFSGSINVTQGISGSLFGTASFASTASFVSLPTFTSGSVLFSNGTTIAQDNANLFWDDTNNRLGIGTATPATTLDVNGAIRASTLRSDVLNNAANTVTLIQFSGTGNRLFDNSGVQVANIRNSNFQIGTTTDTGHKLLVTGSGTSGSLNVDGTLYVSGSRVGIGTSTPTTALHLVTNNSLINTTLKFQTFSTTANILTFNNSNDTEQGLLVGTGNAFSFGTYQQNQINLVGGAGGVSIRTSNGANAHIRFNSGNASYGLSPEIARFVASSGNLLLNTTTDSAKLAVRGSGATTATTALRVENTNASASLVVNDAGNVLVGTATDAGFKLDVNGTARVQGDTTITGNVVCANTIGSVSSAAFTGFTMLLGGGTSNATSYLTVNGTNSAITGNSFALNSTFTFQPTSGTATAAAFAWSGTINQTGGANGITRGLFINPTLTSAANFRAIETTRGNILFQSGSTPLLFVSESGRVGINTSTPSASFHVRGNMFVQNAADTDAAAQFGSNGGGFNIAVANRTDINLKTNAIMTSRGTGITFRTTAGEPNGATLGAIGSGATSATTTLLIQNSTPTNLLSILDNGQVAFTSPTMSLAASQSAFSISPIISASAVVGGQYYGVNITPTFFQTTGSQTETAFRVAATYTGSSAAATGGTNIIADFGSTSAGSQLTVTDVTSGSIYMVNDVSGLPIIEATSDWGVKIYDFPRVVLEKTGSQVNINGTLQVSGSFILPLSQSATPQTGSAYWSGSLLFIYNGTRYMSASFF